MDSDLQNTHISWASHNATLISMLNVLLYNEEFADISIACDGKIVRAHRLILAAFSPYFVDMFKYDENKHPIFFLDDLTFVQLEALISYIYNGKCDIPSEQYPGFIKMAKKLQIRGLSEIYDRDNQTTVAAIPLGNPVVESPTSTKITLPSPNPVTPQLPSTDSAVAVNDVNPVVESQYSVDTVLPSLNIPESIQAECDSNSDLLKNHLNEEVTNSEQKEEISRMFFDTFVASVEMQNLLAEKISECLDSAGADSSDVVKEATSKTETDIIDKLFFDELFQIDFHNENDESQPPNPNADDESSDSEIEVIDLASDDTFDTPGMTTDSQNPADTSSISDMKVPEPFSDLIKTTELPNVSSPSSAGIISTPTPNTPTVIAFAHSSGSTSISTKEMIAKVEPDNSLSPDEPKITPVLKRRKHQPRKRVINTLETPKVSPDLESNKLIRAPFGPKLEVSDEDECYKTSLSSPLYASSPIVPRSPKQPSLFHVILPTPIANRSEAFIKSPSINKDVPPSPSPLQSNSTLDLNSPKTPSIVTTRVLKSVESNIMAETPPAYSPSLSSVGSSARIRKSFLSSILKVAQKLNEVEPPATSYESLEKPKTQETFTIGKRKSFSTPRKRNNHVRNLQFNTPPSLTSEYEQDGDFFFNSEWKAKRQKLTPSSAGCHKKLEWSFSPTVIKSKLDDISEREEQNESLLCENPMAPSPCKDEPPPPAPVPPLAPIPLELRKIWPPPTPRNDPGTDLDLGWKTPILYEKRSLETNSFLPLHHYMGTPLKEGAIPGTPGMKKIESTPYSPSPVIQDFFLPFPKTEIHPKAPLPHVKFNINGSQRKLSISNRNTATSSITSEPRMKRICTEISPFKKNLLTNQTFIDKLRLLSTGHLCTL